MMCDVCGGPMKRRPSYSNGKREIWTCRRKECPGREEFELWGKADLKKLISDAARATELYDEDDLERFAARGGA